MTNTNEIFPWNENFKTGIVLEEIKSSKDCKTVLDNPTIEKRGSKAALNSLSSRERAGVRVIECRFTSAPLYNSSPFVTT